MSTNTTTVEAPANTPFIDTTRDFDASPDRVFRAFTDPALVVKWLGPRTYEMRIDTHDARPGGSYRYIHTDPQGNEFAFSGVFHEVQAPLRIIQTFEFEGYPGQVSMESMTFEDLGGAPASHSIPCSRPSSPGTWLWPTAWNRASRIPWTGWRSFCPERRASRTAHVLNSARP